MTWWMKNPQQVGVSSDARVMRFHRKGQVAPKDLLDQLAATNLGNEFDIAPAPGGSKGLAAFGNPQRVLNIEGEDNHARLITITMQQERTIANLFKTLILGGVPTVVPIALEGPLVGLVEFGTGGGRANAEFDIPSPTLGPGGAVPLAVESIYSPSAVLSNGIMFTLPASSIRVFARNDSRVLPTNDPLATLGTTVPQSNNDNAAKLRVHAAYGNGPVVSKLTRTYMLINSTIVVVTGSTCGIPPFAKRVRFYRNDLAVPLSVTFRMQGYSDGTAAQTRTRATYTIPAGVDSTLELMAQDTSMTVTPDAPGVLFLAAVFELELP